MRAKYEFKIDINYREQSYAHNQIVIIESCYIKNPYSALII